MRRTLLAALLVLPVAGPSWTQVRHWQVGAGGLTWESQGEIAAAVDLRQPDFVQPSGFTTADNIAAGLRWQDGVPEDFTLEGQPRVWDNAAVKASNLPMVDGDAGTSSGERFKGPGIDQTGRVFYFDLGASFPADRIVFYPSPAGQGDFIHAFEISVSDGLRFSREGNPVYEVLQRVDINPEPRADLRFLPQLLRFIKLRIMSPNPFELAELEVHGEGFVPKARYMSRIIDFGDPVNLGGLSLEAERVGPAELPASAVLTVRNGTDVTPWLYYRVDIETQAEIEVTAEEYANLVVMERGPVRYDADKWSAWSRPVEMTAGGVYNLELDFLPGPRRYFQLNLDFAGSSSSVMRVRRLGFTYSAPLASRGLAEVAVRDDPLPAGQVASAATGARTAFICGVRAEFGSGSFRGFDGIHFSTPDIPVFLGLRMGDVYTDVTPDSVRADSTGLWVFFPTRRLTPSNNQPAWLLFAATPLLYNTLFTGWLLDTGGSLPQPLSAGDVGPEIGTGSLNVFGSLGDPLGRFDVRPGVLTPNGDGRNDVADISYDLIFLVEDARVEVGIYDLAGRGIVQLAGIKASAGGRGCTWDGRDRAGQVVAPGQYLCRIAVHTQSGTFAGLRAVAVAY
jgi:hypothetical protein